MLHFGTSYMKHNKSRKQTRESAQNGLEIIFKLQIFANGKRRFHSFKEFFVIHLKNQGVKI